ncbi:MAG: CobW family GTP-binding protein [Burkholderiaceae bacterium]
MRLSKRIRLHILTGFLGSGKSTLLRRYLHGNVEAPRVVVLINEFGEVAIDHTLVRAFSNHAQALTKGCACCSGDVPLRECLLSILTQIENGELAGIEDIVLETTGIADPSRIIGTLAGEMHLTEYLDVSNCVTVVEAGTDASFVDRFPELRNQIACASRIVLSKGDLHPKDVLEETAALVRGLNPLAELMYLDEHSDLTRLFATAASPRGIPALTSEHHKKFNTFQVEIDKTISWPAFSVWLTALLHCHGDQILRFKGIISLPGSSKHALVLQGVRHRVYEPEHLEINESNGLPVFGLIFICASEMEASIRSALDRFNKLTIRLRLPAQRKLEILQTDILPI